MRSLTRITIVLCSALLLTLLSTPVKAQALRVEVLRTLGRDHEFGALLGGAVGPEGSLYLVDISNACVWKMNSTTGEVVKIGGPGQGPGEFNRIYRVAVRDDGVLLAFDLGTGEISEFSSDGRFTRRVKLSLAFRQVGSMLVIGNDVFLAATAVRAGPISDSAIHVFDHDLHYVRSFGVAPKIDDPRVLEYLGTGFITEGPDKTVLYTHRDAYVIDTYGPSGRKLKSVQARVALRGRMQDAIQITDTGGRLSVRSNSTGIESPVPAVSFGMRQFLGGRLLNHEMALDLLDGSGQVAASTSYSAPLGIIGAGPTVGTYWAIATIDDEPVVQLIRVSH